MIPKTPRYENFRLHHTVHHLITRIAGCPSLPPAPIQITPDLQPGEIKSVLVTAGAFETGDLKRPIVLKPMDIATTPSALGDIYGALTTLPGTQVVGEEGGLYVRGGEGYETRTYIDGMQVHKP